MHCGHEGSQFSLREGVTWEAIIIVPISERCKLRKKREYRMNADHWRRSMGTNHLGNRSRERREEWLSFVIYLIWRMRWRLSLERDHFYSNDIHYEFRILWRQEKEKGRISKEETEVKALRPFRKEEYNEIEEKILPIFAHDPHKYCSTLQFEENENREKERDTGRDKSRIYTRYLTVVISLFLSLKREAVDPSESFSFPLKNGNNWGNSMERKGKKWAWNSNIRRMAKTEEGMGMNGREGLFENEGPKQRMWEPRRLC